MNLYQLLRRAATLFPNSVAAVDDQRTVTYRTIDQRVRNFASHLQLAGVAPGDRIAVLDVNSIEYIESYFAAAALGAILCPLNFRLSNAELAAILADCQAEVLIANAQFAPIVQATINAGLQTGTTLSKIIWIGDPPASNGWSVEEVSYQQAVAEAGEVIFPDIITASTVAQLYYTSGTTGRPKGVMLTHGNVYLHAVGTVAEFGLSESDRWGHIAPMFHLADAWATFAITLVGGCHVIVPKFQAEQTLAAIEQQKITITNLIPTMLNLMVKHPQIEAYSYSSLRYILSGGAPIPPEVVRQIIATFGCDYVQTYGMTETSPYLTLSLLKNHLKNLPQEDQLRFKSKTGRAFITVELQVVRDNGNQVSNNEQEVGEILVRGGTVTPGYWNRREETNAAFQNGWLKTGDLAVIDEEGYVTIVDRKKDMIITGGENVYSTEVENILYQHPEILEAAAFGLADDVFGETVAAAVVMLEPNKISADEIIEFCRKYLSGYKIPRHIFFLPTLPRTGTGKISKRAIREELAATKPTTADFNDEPQ